VGVFFLDDDLVSESVEEMVEVLENQMEVLVEDIRGIEIDFALELFIGTVFLANHIVHIEEVEEVRYQFDAILIFKHS
jgi:hypothetical protein